MAVMTDEERRRCWARCMRGRLYRQAVPTDIGKPGLRAAVDAADQWIDDNLNAFRLALPAAYRNASDAQQRQYLLAAVARRRVADFRSEED